MLGVATSAFAGAGAASAHVAGVLVAPQQGWTAKTTQQTFSTPIKTDDGDITQLVSYMTAACSKALNATFASVVQADKPATQKLEEAMFFGVTGPNGMTPVPQGHVVTDRRFTAATVHVDTSKGDRLGMAFTAKATIQMQDTAGKPYTMATSRVLRFLLVQNSGTDRQRRPFLIDSWGIKLTSSPPQQAK